MAITINITSVYGVKDNGELVNIVVEGNSHDMTHILLTIYGKKLNRNVIRQISSGEFNESIEQEIISSAQCECGAPIKIKAFCLADSSVSDIWEGELQCLEIGRGPAVAVAQVFKAEEAGKIEEAGAVEEIREEAKEVEEERAGLLESVLREMTVPEKEEEATVGIAEFFKAEEAEEIEKAEEVEEIREEAKEMEEEGAGLPELPPHEIAFPEKEEEETVGVAEVFEAEESEEIEKAEEIEEIREEAKEMEEERVGLPEPAPLEIAASEKEEEVTPAVAEDLEAKEAEEIVKEVREEVKELAKEIVVPPESPPPEAAQKKKSWRLPLPNLLKRKIEEAEEVEEIREEAREREEEKVGLPEPALLEPAASEIEEEVTVAVAQVFETKEEEDIEKAEEVEEEAKELEEEKDGLPELLPPEISAPEKEEEAVVTVAEGLEAGEAEKIGEEEEVEEIREEAGEVEEERAGLPESAPLEIAVPEKEEEAAVTGVEPFKAEEAVAIEKAEEVAEGVREEVKESAEERVGPPESPSSEIEKKKRRWRLPLPKLLRRKLEESEEIEEEAKEKEEERAGPPGPAPLEIAASEKEEEAAVSEAFEAIKGEEEEEAEELKIETKRAGEEAGLEDSLNIPAPLIEKVPGVAVTQALEAEEAKEAKAAKEEAKEEREERADFLELPPLEMPAPEKKEKPPATATEVLSLFPFIEIKSVHGLTYNGEVVDIVVECNSSGDKRILVKIQWGNIKYYKIVNPSSAGEFSVSFEQDILRSGQIEGGDLITVDALYLANSSIFDTWQGDFYCVEKTGAPTNILAENEKIIEEKDGGDSEYTR